VLLQKISYYPPCPQPEVTLGIAPHTDMCAVTVLLPNDVEGLQIFKDGRWHDVKHVPEALIIFMGDQIEASALLITSTPANTASLFRQFVNTLYRDFEQREIISM
jgi:flavonol synthase